jgi:hypothetical protein
MHVNHIDKIINSSQKKVLISHKEDELKINVTFSICMYMLHIHTKRHILYTIFEFDDVYCHIFR